MIIDLIKIADKLDSIGLTKEADLLDGIIKKLAGGSEIFEYKVLKGDTFSEIVEMYGDPAKSYQEQLDLNKQKNPKFDPNIIFPGQSVFLHIPEEAEEIQPIEEIE